MELIPQWITHGSLGSRRIIRLGKMLAASNFHLERGTRRKGQDRCLDARQDSWPLVFQRGGMWHKRSDRQASGQPNCTTYKRLLTVSEKSEKSVRNIINNNKKKMVNTVNICEYRKEIQTETFEFRGWIRAPTLPRKEPLGRQKQSGASWHLRCSVRAFVWHSKRLRIEPLGVEIVEICGSRQSRLPIPQA